MGEEAGGSERGGWRERVRSQDGEIRQPAMIHAFCLFTILISIFLLILSIRVPTNRIFSPLKTSIFVNKVFSNKSVCCGHLMSV